MNIEISPKEYEKWLNWDDAILYCELLVIDGKNEWRLPTLKELEYIYKCKNDFYGAYYWTSTEYDDDKNMAWVMNMYNNYYGQYDKDDKFWIRAVQSS